jgi:membrane associated rhomboid family serine protease
MDKKFIASGIPPLLIILIMWSFFVLNEVQIINGLKFGLLPNSANQLWGIVTMVFVHGSVEHILFNTFPVMVLGWFLFYFYEKISVKVLLFIWLFSGIGLWFIGRPVFHIGASGLVYGLITFLMVSGIIRRNKKLALVSLIVIFFYGSTLWGVIPGKEGVSWEGHLSGGFFGALAAIFWRRKGSEADLNFSFFPGDNQEEDEYAQFEN